MLFNSTGFLLFFVLVFILNALLGQRLFYRNLMLLIASYYFYASWNGYYLGLIILSTLIDYILAMKLESTEDTRHRKRFLTLSVCANLGLLGLFKYYNFFIDSAYTFFSAIGLPFQHSTLELLLPVGISFYTFQSMSYTIDVYYKRMPAEHNLMRFALYIAFFPQLVAGPIVRAIDFIPQLYKKYEFNKEDFMLGTSLIWIGLVKKVLLADFFARYADAYFSHMDMPHGLLDLLLGAYAFAFQIYFDFSGYTDTAIGCALLLGYRIPRNFNYPYAATTLADFWRRWHISLSSWLRDYLYIPLGGGRVRKARNILMTMGLSGLWHGAGWNFILWGLLLGFGMNIESWLKKIISYRPPVWLARLLVFHLVCLGWILFRMQDIGNLSLIPGHLETWSLTGITYGQVTALLLAASLLIYQHISAGFELRTILFRIPAPLQIGTHALMLTLIVALGNFGNPFIYFQF